MSRFSTSGCLVWLRLTNSHPLYQPPAYSTYHRNDSKRLNYHIVYVGWCARTRMIRTVSWIYIYIFSIVVGNVDLFSRIRLFLLRSTKLATTHTRWQTFSRTHTKRKKAFAMPSPYHTPRPWPKIDIWQRGSNSYDSSWFLQYLRVHPQLLFIIMLRTVHITDDHRK